MCRRKTTPAMAERLKLYFVRRRCVMRVLRMLFALVLLAGLAFLLFGYWAGSRG